MTDSSYDRILKTALREAEAGIVALVEREFADLPQGAKTLPILGGDWPFIIDYDRTTQKKLAIAALRAKKWFEFEGPLWAQPLLLKAEECYPLLNNHPNGNNYRALLRGSYGQHARTMGWVIERMSPFERFCASGSG